MSRCRRLEKGGANANHIGCLKKKTFRMGTHSQNVGGEWILLLSGVRGVLEESIPGSSGLSFLIRDTGGGWDTQSSHLFYLGVYGSQLSIWIVWHSWGSELVRLLRVGSWMSERVWVHIHISEVHLPVCGTCGWLVCLHLPQSSILCVCVCACPHARARVPGRTRECGCARDGRPLVCLG